MYMYHGGQLAWRRHTAGTRCDERRGAGDVYTQQKGGGPVLAPLVADGAGRPYTGLLVDVDCCCQWTIVSCVHVLRTALRSPAAARCQSCMCPFSGGRDSSSRPAVTALKLPLCCTSRPCTASLAVMLPPRPGARASSRRRRRAGVPHVQHAAAALSRRPSSPRPCATGAVHPPVHVKHSGAHTRRPTQRGTFGLCAQPRPTLRLSHGALTLLTATIDTEGGGRRARRVAGCGALGVLESARYCLLWWRSGPCERVLWPGRKARCPEGATVVRALSALPALCFGRLDDATCGHAWPAAGAGSPPAYPTFITSRLMTAIIWRWRATSRLCRACHGGCLPCLSRRPPEAGALSGGPCSRLEPEPG